MLSLNSTNSVTKKLLSKKEDCRIGTQDLLRKRQRLYHCVYTTETIVTDQIIIRNLIHASVISLNSLNSVNSTKVLLHLEKTPF